MRLIRDALKDSPKSVDLNLNMARLYRLSRQFDLADSHLRAAESYSEYGYQSEEMIEEAARLERDRKARAVFK
jgi:hypothetical protein